MELDAVRSSLRWATCLVLGGLGALSHGQLQVGGQTVSETYSAGSCSVAERVLVFQKVNQFASMLGLAKATPKNCKSCLFRGFPSTRTYDLVLDDGSQYVINGDEHYSISFRAPLERFQKPELRGKPPLRREQLIAVATSLRNRLVTNRKLEFRAAQTINESPGPAYKAKFPEGLTVQWAEWPLGYRNTAGFWVKVFPLTGEVMSIGWGYKPYTLPKKVMTRAQAEPLAIAYVQAYRKKHPHSNSPTPTILPGQNKLPVMLLTDWSYLERSPLPNTHFYYYLQSSWTYPKPNGYIGERWAKFPPAAWTKHQPARIIHKYAVRGVSSKGVVKYDTVWIDAETGKVCGGGPVP